MDSHIITRTEFENNKIFLWNGDIENPTGSAYTYDRLIITPYHREVKLLDQIKGYDKLRMKENKFENRIVNPLLYPDMSNYMVHMMKKLNNDN